MKIIVLSAVAFTLAACCNPSGEGCPEYTTPESQKAKIIEQRCAGSSKTQDQYVACLKKSGLIVTQ